MNDDVEFLMTFVKKEPCKMRWFWSLCSLSFLKALNFDTSFAFLYISYWIFLFVLVIDSNLLMSSFMDVFKLERETVWNWVNFVDGRMTFKRNLFLGRNILLRFAQIGSSSHFRIYLEARVSKVSQIHVLDISVIVNSHEIFESK